MAVRDRMTVVGTILVEFDKEIDLLDRAVYDAAYYDMSGPRGNLDAQRDYAMCPDFQPPVKLERDRKMEQRNAVASLLGFGRRKPYDLSPRDYVVGSDGVLVPR